MQRAGSNANAWRVRPWFNAATGPRAAAHESSSRRAPAADGGGRAGIVGVPEVARDDDELTVARAVAVGGEFHGGCGVGKRILSRVPMQPAEPAGRPPARRRAGAIAALTGVAVLLHAALLSEVRWTWPTPPAPFGAVQVRALDAPSAPDRVIAAEPGRRLDADAQVEGTAATAAPRWGSRGDGHGAARRRATGGTGRATRQGVETRHAACSARSAHQWAHGPPRTSARRWRLPTVRTATGETPSRVPAVQRRRAASRARRPLWSSPRASSRPKAPSRQRAL